MRLTALGEDRENAFSLDLPSAFRIYEERDAKRCILKGTPMKNGDLLSSSSAILQETKGIGTHLVGFANVDGLKIAPSFVFAFKMPGI